MITFDFETQLLSLCWIELKYLYPLLFIALRLMIAPRPPLISNRVFHSGQTSSNTCFMEIDDVGEMEGGKTLLWIIVTGKCTLSINL